MGAGIEGARMSRRILIVCLAIDCLGVGIAGGYLIRGAQNPAAGGTVKPSQRAGTTSLTSSASNFGQPFSRFIRPDLERT